VIDLDALQVMVALHVTDGRPVFHTGGFGTFTGRIYNILLQSGEPSVGGGPAGALDLVILREALIDQSHPATEFIKDDLLGKLLVAEINSRNNLLKHLIGRLEMRVVDRFAMGDQVNEAFGLAITAPPGLDGCRARRRAILQLFRDLSNDAAPAIRVVGRALRVDSVQVTFTSFRFPLQIFRIGSQISGNG